MRFLGIAGFVLAASLMSAATASADCMCLVVEPEAPAYSPPLRVEGPQSQALEGEEAASKPFDEIWSDIEAARLTLVVQADNDFRGKSANVLWCEGGNNHRCQQGHPTPTSPELIPPVPALHPEVTVNSAFVRSLARSHVIESDGPSGIRFELLRPPR